MRKRPSLNEALAVLNQYKDINSECEDALVTYNNCKETNEFFAARLVIEIVDHFYHIVDTEGLKHG